MKQSDSENAGEADSEPRDGRTAPVDAAEIAQAATPAPRQGAGVSDKSEELRGLGQGPMIWSIAMLFKVGKMVGPVTCKG